MLQIFISAFIALMTVSCAGPRYVDYFPYHDDGAPKPRVALMTLVNSSESTLPWDISEELSRELYYALMNSGELYVLSPQEVGPIWMRQQEIDFFGQNISFAREFKNVDFIVALELIEHSLLPCDPIGLKYPPCNRMLTLRTRVKVIDVRCSEPRTVLYEIVKSDFAMVSPRDEVNYEEICWGSDGYPLTPWGRVHQRMVRSLTSRLEEILASVR